MNAIAKLKAQIEELKQSNAEMEARTHEPLQHEKEADSFMASYSFKSQLFTPQKPSTQTTEDLEDEAAQFMASYSIKSSLR
jgi:hypothetical protein